MLGQSYARFDDLLKHVRAIVADRTISARAEMRPKHHTAKDDPMDIGEVATKAVEKALMAVGFKGKGKGDQIEQGPGWKGQ